MSHPISDRRILSTTWEVLDKRPNEVFGCPALSLNQLYNALNTTFEANDPSRIIPLLGDHTKDLLGTDHKATLKSVRKGDNKDYWVVFKPEPAPMMEHKLAADEVGKGEGLMDGTKEDPGSSGEDLGHQGGEGTTKTVELLPDLPGGANHDHLPKPTTKSARKKIFSAIGLRKDRERNDVYESDSHGGHSEAVPNIGSHPDRPDEAKVRPDRLDTQVHHHNHDYATDQREQQKVQEPTARSIGSPLSTNEEKHDKDWLEQTSQWDSKRAKPEREGTEMDIIDSYDYVSASPSRANHDHRAQVEEGKRAKAVTPDLKGIGGEFETRHDREAPDGRSKNIDQGDELKSRDEVPRPKVKTKFDFTDENDISNHKSEPELNGEYYDYQQTHGTPTDDDDDDKDKGNVRDQESLKGEKMRGKSRTKHNRPDEVDHTVDDPVESDGSDISHRPRHKHKSRGEHRSNRRRDDDKASKDGRRLEPGKRRSSRRKTDGEESNDDFSDSSSKSKKNRKTSSSSNPDNTMPEPPTPFFIKSFEGLPFEPDTSIVNSLSWLKERYHLLLAEVVVLLSIVYIIQASGL